MNEWKEILDDRGERWDFERERSMEEADDEGFHTAPKSYIVLPLFSSVNPHVGLHSKISKIQAVQNYCAFLSSSVITFYFILFIFLEFSDWNEMQEGLLTEIVDYQTEHPRCKKIT